MTIQSALGAVRVDPAQLSAERPSLPIAHHLWLRRLAFWGPIATCAVAGTALACVATAGAPSALRVPLLLLLAMNLGYMGLTGTPSVLGFVLHVSRRRRVVPASPSGVSRTAVLMPIHMEDPQAVFAGIEVMARSVADAGLALVDFYVLSDTQDLVHAAKEQAAYDALLLRAPNLPPLHYRRRADNRGRKVGNVAEFCERRGALYDYMVVLDADSLMSASAISTLIGLMDANPKSGIIQTVPYPVGRETFFARMQQFSARLYGPLLVEGLTFWQQSDGNYWGHNAIVRIAPFMAHCELPVLKGPEPWGGEILCHDVVEAGLMRAAGWDVWVLPQVMESYEAVPANLVDFAARERRWCQGNLQHAGVIGQPGLRPVGRFHLGYGIAHYLSAPVALAFLALATIDAILGGGFAHALFASGAASACFIALGAALLYAGKLTSLVAALADGAEARLYGGRLALLASAIIEQLSAFVMSAVLIVLYTRYVLDLVRGRTVRWDAQVRDDRGVSWAEGWRRMRLPTFIGLAWLVCLPMMPHGTRGFMLPLLLGLLAACPLATLSSRISLGRWARSVRLMLTPEEAHPPSILRAYQRVMQSPAHTERPVPPATLRHLAAQGETP